MEITDVSKVITPKWLAELSSLVDNGTISLRTAKQILREYIRYHFYNEKGEIYP